MARFLSLLFACAIFALVDVVRGFCFSDGTLTINNPASATSFLSSCTTYSGDIVVGTGFAGNLALPSDLTAIEGKLSAYSVPGLTGIDLNLLGSLSRLDINDCESLTKLVSRFPLVIVEQFSVRYTGVTNFNDLLLSSQVPLTDAIAITWNSSLDADFEVPFVGAGSVAITSYGTGTAAFRFPNFATTNDLQIQGGVTQVDFPILGRLDGTGCLSITRSALETFTAPQLLDTGCLYIQGNSALSEISLPILARIDGSLAININPALSAVNFPLLASIYSYSGEQVIVDNCYLGGNFSSVSLPSLTDVSNGCSQSFIVNSSSTLDCTQLDEQAKKGFLGSHFTCTASHSISTASNPATTKLPNSVSTSVLPTGAKIGIAIGAILGSSALYLSAWLIYRRYRTKQLAVAHSSELYAPVPVELPAEKGDAELEAMHGYSEAIGGRASGLTEVFEMPAGHGNDLEVGEGNRHERGDGNS